MASPRDIKIVSMTAVLLAQVAVAQTATFTGTGRLAANKEIKAYGVSPGGSYVVGDAIDAGNNTQGFLWSSTEGLRALGFLPGGQQNSHARDVAVTSTGEIKICGYAKDAGGNDQAFLWTGDATGAGTFELIPRLSGGAGNTANALLIAADGVVYVTGDSKSTASGSDWQAYRWRSNSPGGSLALGFLGSTRKDSRGYGIAWRDSTTYIVGNGRSGWSGGNDSREAAHWKPQTGDPSDPGGLNGDRGLTSICDGEGWQILAGPNGIAESAAHAADLQITPVGTSGLDPNTVVVSAGSDNILKGQTIAQGDDFVAPLGMSPTVNESIYLAVSPDGRYRVGRSNNIPGSNTFWEANLRDIRNRDFSDPDNCGGFTFQWPLGFCKVNNLGQAIADNYSEAYGVSNGSGAGSRAGLVVVGSSRDLNDTVPRPQRASICMIQDGPDMWFLRHQGASPTDYGAHVAGRFKDMRNLQWLLSNDFQLDLSGWDLWEARAVSDNGQVVVGWGLHNGVPEGFVALIPGLPKKGACCHRPSLECTIDFQADCDGEWLGPESVCTRCCPKPFADSDQDGDVDMVDFATFQTCYTTAPQILPGCECWDINEDGKVDDVDFTRAFEVCGTGAEIDANPDCQ